MKLTVIDELYRSVENEECLSLSPEYTAKIMQVAVACSGQHVIKISEKMQLDNEAKSQLVHEIAQSIQLSLENYVKQAQQSEKADVDMDSEGVNRKHVS
ncbi:hypothetical protein [Piscirickettsia litoralis]|uniref:Uncharacterized protein n=1 Tax=Piscirickettsia litoralis TaxID=1891921 RepID=A0ABX3A3E8_9GAMM|nr:hypothetical protein [Piscirickettsia litoralis]ODN43399.1 hypothetical protein BGC07_11280 [Piscirickettsia litoralis]